MNTEEKIEKIIHNLGIKSLNPMQIAAQEVIRKNTDTLLLSPTGSGKTLAFLLPLFSLLKPDTKGIQALIIVPSRELAMQIEKVWRSMGTGFKVNSCYGGHSIDVEMNNLSNPPALLIGTPGRLVDHLGRNSFDSQSIKILVLDEFDKSLELGFHEEMMTLIEQIPALEKRLLVSATHSLEIPDFVGGHQWKELDFLHIKEKDLLKTVIVWSEEKDKIESLFKLLCNIGNEQAIVFCNHRDASQRISERLSEKGIFATFYHGGMDQMQRERALLQFRNASVRSLITTDLAARGLDIPQMKHVIHYHLPMTEAEFTHRNGRTARMTETGTSYLLLHTEEKRLDYVDYDLQEFRLDHKAQPPTTPFFQSIYISGGKKNKLGKVDIVGFFSQIGKLEKTDIGQIELQDFAAYVAIKNEKVAMLLKNIAHQKMKGKKYKIEIAKAVEIKDED